MSLPKQIAELLKTEPMTGNQIAEKLQASQAKVRQALWKMKDAGRLDASKSAPSLSSKGPRTVTVWKIKDENISQG